MSEVINNREYRKNVIKDILLDLHNGRDPEEAKAKFTAAFKGVAASEISAAEAALIAEGVPVEAVQKLCDVHSALFRDSLQEEQAVMNAADRADRPGHPVHTLRLENRAIEKIIWMEIKPLLDSYIKSGGKDTLAALKGVLVKLADIKRHYQRKENLIFPFMEKHDITAPPKVMWAVDDEIRGLIAAAVVAVSRENPDPAKIAEIVNSACTKINEMIFKEETIMAPMILEVFTQDEWKHIADESCEIGYCFIDEPAEFARAGNSPGNTLSAEIAAGSIVLPTGSLQLNELSAILNALPVDISFVDKNDTVKYFSQSEERIFPRTKAVIGRRVINCHPPASAHIVEAILAEFKSGRKTHEDFWIKMGSKYIYIRYFAVKDTNGEYLGALEVTQNIAPIQALTGEKRLVEIKAPQH
ncbi:MAG: DUF438 domain-containing protein [Treponema sp.]|nr:DUF438 domain-containing protein [Treponema sp.]